MATKHDRPALELLAAVIAHSQIIVAERVLGAAAARLPDGYDDVDVAILDWIAAEGRRARHAYRPM